MRRWLLQIIQSTCINLILNLKICPLEQRPNGSTEKVKYLVLLPNCHENPKKMLMMFMDIYMMIP
jgi:hypothetical protein